MKRMLGMKKKRRQPGDNSSAGDVGLDEDHEAGLQGFSGSGGSGLGSGIGSTSPPSLGMTGSRSSTASAKYQYAMRHYQETADPLHGDVDNKTFNRYENPMNDAHARGQGSALGGGESSVRRRTPEVTATGSGYGGGGNGNISGGATTVVQSQHQQPPSFEDLTSMEESPGKTQQPYPQQQGQGYVPPTKVGQSPHDAIPANGKQAAGGEGGPMMSPAIGQSDAASTHSTGGGDGGQIFYASGSGSACPPDPHLPDITYEEHYGDAYVGKPIKYIYPAGYQSMRPRSRPWKLSIAVFILFTWLTVFIVGYCSDMAAKDNDYAYLDDSIDDDQVVIEQRWCGSRPLYGMWVMSVLITGMSCAYCSIIGYIQVRDFSIANGRSQPPEMAGRSDYYVKVGDGDAAGGGGGSGRSGSGRSSYSSYQDGYGGESTIYQADGTPQFWGSHIYKPTQAAVAVTSR